MIVVLDHGHGQKAPERFDPGVVSGDVREVDLVAVYLRHAADELRARGHQVYPIGDGPYAARHRIALGLLRSSPGLYVQCHVNAGGGRYALVEHDGRSELGAGAASALAAVLEGLPEVSGGRTVALDAGARGFVCLAGIWPAPRSCGLVYEPLFIDSLEHAPLRTPEGLARVGLALATGIDAWSRTVTRRPDAAHP